MQPAILYVDDEPANLALFERTFDEEFRVLTAQSAAAARSILETSKDTGMVVSDQRMAPMTGIDLLTQVALRWPTVTRMLLTAYSDRDLLLQAIQRGKVHDYVLKPWRSDDLRLRLTAALDLFERQSALTRAALQRDVLAAELRERDPSILVGLESGLRSVKALIERVAPSDASVLIRGESGTGKELVARALHAQSSRAMQPFVRVNCAAFAAGVLESELFGHEAGAFTGAKQFRRGRFEQADGGTLFLDEIGDISPDVQVRLLRVLQEREFERVGGNRTLKVDIRVISATHRDLETMICERKFRQDLFFRLNVVPIRVPPLRERSSDVATLASYFLAHFAGQFGKRLSLSSETVEALAAYDWPGNVRELRNAIERAVVLADDALVLEPDDFQFSVASPARHAPAGDASGTSSIFEEIARSETQKIVEALRQARGSKARAARLLGIPRTTLNDRIRKLEIK